MFVTYLLHSYLTEPEAVYRQVNQCLVWTLISCERLFSSVGYIVNKRRSAI